LPCLQTDTDTAKTSFHWVKQARKVHLHRFGHIA